MCRFRGGSVWDYQILGNTASGELEVFARRDQIRDRRRIVPCAEAAEAELAWRTFRRPALCNAFRYNYGDLEIARCSLTIGAKTSICFFSRREKFFSRSINLGGETRSPRTS